jgi:uncharacterized protein involved in cysteine biosynthesis
MIFHAFYLAIEQLSDPRFRRVVALGVVLAVALLAAVYAGFMTLFELFFPASFTLPWIGEITWVHSLISWASIPIMLVLSVFLMVPVASAFTGLFLDDVADAVEEVHYPHLAPARRLSFAEGIWDGLVAFGVVVVANLLALVVYLIFAPFAPVIFWALNGYLLGWGFFQLLAVRRLGRSGARVLRRRHMLTIWAAGILMAVPLSVPLLNLLVPVLGAATFTHITHALIAKNPGLAPPGSA